METDDFLTFECGGDSRLVLTRSATGTSEPQTKASWLVDPHGNTIGLLQFKRAATD